MKVNLNIEEDSSQGEDLNIITGQGNLISDRSQLKTADKGANKKRPTFLSHEKLKPAIKFSRNGLI